MNPALDLRRLPSVDALLHQLDVAALAGTLPREVLVELVRAELEQARTQLRAGRATADAGMAATVEAGLTGALVSGILGRARALRRLPLRPVINATGVVLHTNLGRAPLSAAAVQAMGEAAAGYSNLEYDLEAGQRGSRHTHLEELIRRTTGAAAAVGVNNNAAAVLLVLAELAAGREVIVSRGQAVEIGGGFRIPDVLRQSGARLIEVGTTNRTRLADYAAAMGPETAALLHVHTSNFRIVGFTERVPVHELAALGREHGVPVVDDQGSGCLLDTSPFGIAGTMREPTIQESIDSGVDLVCFSGDKLLGGPQAGIIAGRADLITRLKRHPLTRALRLDKIAIAGLAATLLHYRLAEAVREIPVWRMISAPLDELEARASRWHSELSRSGLQTSVVREASAIGGGSLPGVTLPTAALALRPSRLGSVDAAAAALRNGDPAIVARIVGDRLLSDPRTVAPGEEPGLLAALLGL